MNDNRGPAGEVIWCVCLLVAGCIFWGGLFLLAIIASC